MTTPIPVDLEAGRYIVLLEEAPAATYDGGEAGLAPTQPGEGEKLDASARDVQRYSDFLENRQADVAAEAGVTPDGNLTITLNAFTANLTAAQAQKLAGAKGVQSVVPDEIMHPDAVPSTEFLGLSGPGGVWEKVGGIEAAGAGTVVGVVDTGIAPENPAFAGEPLGTAPGSEPYLDGNTVVFAKADGNLFKSARVTGEEWTEDAYSTKLVGAKYFNAGAAANGFDFGPDYVSPRDADGHGSHTASTAAGNHDVAATVEGVDFGAISGVAPAAKVAAYKACYVGPDPLVTTDDICALSDLLSAINAAAADGVDVINYSIGGGAATTTLATEDIAFFNAASAGIFVAVSAGNDGPGASTADHASPWYTTVAASTVPTYEGTVEFGSVQAVGATVTVPFGETISGPSIYAGDAALAGVSVDEAKLCFLDRLDPAKVAGKVVVCDRGTNARIEKSQAVEEAGGTAMILVNVTPGSLDNDFHSVPTVHIQATYREQLLEYVRATPDAPVTLHGDNITAIETPTPVVAGFSSRGPMLADGSDVLKPDISAPGVAILAATQNAAGADPTFGFKSGTSMSSPHIAGLAALYLGERPNATPAEIKSAMMTTAYDTVNEDGSTNTDPFAQGAGHVDPTRFFEPGLVYDSGPTQWLQYLVGKGLYADDEVLPIDGSDLNLASIAIGSLSGPQTVTRSVRATTAGTYTAAAAVPGMDVIVEPASLTLAAGDTGTFTVSFTKTDAAPEQWTTGFLTWTGPTTARSPIAIYPVTADAPASVSGEGIAGSASVEITPGITGELPLNLSGLAPAVLQTEEIFGNGVDVPGHSGNETSGDEDGYSYYIVDVPEGAALARFDLDSSDDAGSDLDLVVYRVVGPTNLSYYQKWQSASGSADESVVLDDPTAGTYLVEAHLFATPNPMTWDLTTAVVGSGGEGSLTATPNPLPVTESTPTSYSLSWTGLAPASRYYGVVQYGESDVRTVLTVDAGPAAPVATSGPTITGAAKVGKTLTAKPGTWDPTDVTFAYQWLRDGAAIDGATARTYKVASEDAGRALSVQVTATQAGNINAGVAVSEPVQVKATSKTKVTVSPRVGTTPQDFTITVVVTPSAGPAANGPVKVRVNAKSYTGTLVDGTATIELPKQKRGVYVVLATYPGSANIEASVGATVFLVTK
ncbi:S8 family serine peptidase [Microbacterium yannicii]|uniref:S8 family serine peptidase n=1 Tax=Microbacterium yannicii TaxID=671622 RepID=UPI001888E5E1|nr:S8 family serine peptidase [Microbacterium yannicii]MCO5951224.1 S8 family serine peptidase [Microbacterium yannicii]